MFTLGIALAPPSALLPDELRSLVAVPIGVGLASLGIALLAERRAGAAAPVPGLEIPQFRSTAAE
jgi:hypothetical protein